MSQNVSLTPRIFAFTLNNIHLKSLFLAVPDITFLDIRNSQVPVRMDVLKTVF